MYHDYIFQKINRKICSEKMIEKWAKKQKWKFSAADDSKTAQWKPVKGSFNPRNLKVACPHRFYVLNFSKVGFLFKTEISIWLLIEFKTKSALFQGYKLTQQKLDRGYLLSFLRKLVFWSYDVQKIGWTRYVKLTFGLTRGLHMKPYRLNDSLGDSINYENSCQKTLR